MKLYAQKADHACGAACVRSIMDHFGKKVLSERTLLKRLHATFKEGIDPAWIVHYLREQNLSAEYVSPETGVFALKRRMDKGWIPIVVWADWGGHYCIVGELRLDSMWPGGYIRFLDPAAEYEHRNYTDVCGARFKSMWNCPFHKAEREVIYVKAKE